MNERGATVDRPRGTVTGSVRSRILAAAQDAFSARGYADVGVREIAAAAACDTTLIRRHFGSKEALFEEALARTLDVGVLVDGAREDFGARAVRYFAQTRTDPGSPLAMLIFATAEASSRAVALRLLEKHVVTPIAAWLGEPHGIERAVRISMLCSGYFLYSRILPIAALGGRPAEQDGPWLARQLQSVVDELP